MITFERILSCFDKKNDNLLWEINIDNVDFNLLKSILKPQNDEHLHLIYVINKDNYIPLKNLLKIEFDMKKNIYEIGCFKV